MRINFLTILFSTFWVGYTQQVIVFKEKLLNLGAGSKFYHDLRRSKCPKRTCWRRKGQCWLFVRNLQSLILLIVEEINATGN